MKVIKRVGNTRLIDTGERFEIQKRMFWFCPWGTIDYRNWNWWTKREIVKELEDELNKQKSK